MSDQDPKPVGEEEPQVSEPTRRAPGSEQEYQGGKKKSARPALNRTTRSTTTVGKSASPPELIFIFRC
jgi:hypothetical protein